MRESGISCVSRLRTRLSVNTDSNTSKMPSGRILQALNLIRRREVKIDLFLSFAGWLTNVVEEGKDGEEDESMFG